MQQAAVVDKAPGGKSAFRLTPRWRQWAGIDLRSLAVLRMFLAVSVLAVLCSFWPDMRAVFSDSGLYPREHLIRGQADYSWSVYFVSGHVAWAYFLYCVTALCAIALFFGYHTRAATILCWVLMASHSTRVSIFTSGGDSELNFLLFWAMFLPLGARFSVDAAMSKLPRRQENLYVSVATFAILLQVMYVYLFSALLKTGSLWRESYDAVYYVLNTPHIRSPLAYLISDMPQLLRVMTAYVYYLELVAVFFLFSPVRTALCRLLILPNLIALHLGFVLFIAIGAFPLIAISGLMVFVPGVFWDWAGRQWKRLLKTPGKVVLYYDLDCGFCRKTCRIFSGFCRPFEFEVLPAQQEREIYQIMQRDNSWVVDDGMGNRYTRWAAVAWVWRRSPILWPLGCLFWPKFMEEIGDYIYGFIAGNRGAFGKLTGALLREHQKDLAPPAGRFVSSLLWVLIVMVMLWNIGGLYSQPLGKPPREMSVAMYVLKLRQRMKFFAPQPLHSTRYTVIDGRLANGERVDLLWRRRQAPSYRIPEHSYAIFPSYRWRKFFDKTSYLKRYSSDIARYYCDSWEEWRPEGAAPIRRVTISQYRRLSKPDKIDPQEVKRVFRYSYDCKKDDKKKTESKKNSSDSSKTGKSTQVPPSDKLPALGMENPGDV